MSTQDKQNTTSSLATLQYFAKHYPLQSVWVVCALLLSGLSEVIGITALLPLVGIILDDSTTPAAMEPGTLEHYTHSFLSTLGIAQELGPILILIVGAICLKGLILFLALKYVGHVSADITKNTRMRLMRALMYACWPYYGSLVGGHISNAISEQAQRAGHCYMQAGRTVAAFIQIIIYGVFAFLLSPDITLMAFIAGGIMVFGMKKFIRMARSSGQDMSSAMNSMLARLNEALLGVKPIKAMGEEARFLSFLERDAQASCAAQKNVYTSSLLLQVVYEPTILIIISIGLYYILTMTTLSVTEAILLAFLFHRLLGYTSLMQNMYQNMAQSESALWSLIRQSEDAEKQAETLHSGAAPVLEKEICLDNVDISYDGKTFLFQDFSCSIPANQLTLLFGVSGIGKTTLTDAILGLHEPKTGRITIDGTPLSEIDIRRWREQTGYVPQETFLFHDTIAHNVTLGVETYSDTQIIQALKDAAAWDFVNALEHRLDTIVGERGSKLSGGQRQRIALARSLIRQPKLLILDEATTGLDAQTEAAVIQSLAMLKQKGHTTIIMISHNPEMKQIADTVISLS